MFTPSSRRSYGRPKFDFHTGSSRRWLCKSRCTACAARPARTCARRGVTSSESGGSFSFELTKCVVSRLAPSGNGRGAGTRPSCWGLGGLLALAGSTQGFVARLRQSERGPRSRLAPLTESKAQSSIETRAPHNTDIDHATVSYRVETLKTRLSRARSHARD